MAMKETTSAKETASVATAETYEPPALVKHGSLSELTLGGTPVSGGGCPWGGSGGHGPW
jgi:hypothetical protein